MPQYRRGISSVVGALFFTVLMIAGFSVLSLALDAQTDIVTTQRMVSDIEIKKQQEDFDLLVSADGNNILNVSVNNKGQNPIEISSIWITNKTLPDQPATRFEINYDDAFVPSGFNTNVISSQTLQMVPDIYGIKVVSSYGTIKTTEFALGVVGSSGLRAELITDPPDVVLGKNVTVAMLVTNTGDELIQNVEPEMQTPGGSANIVSSSSHTPSIVNLNPGESVMFSWDYQVNGVSGDDIIFSALARGDLVGIDDVSSNIATDSSLLRKAGEGGGGADPDIVNDDLLARPQLFFIIPSSQGESSNAEALWGINVVNPINAPMEVSKLIITAFAPGANANNVMFDRGGNSCTFNPVSPITGPDSDWSCPSENALMWQDNSNPIIIPANSSRSFLTKVEPGKPTGNTGLESILVQGSVFTTLGSFGKSGYQSTMSSDPTSIVNVYLSDVVDSRASTNIQSVRTGIIPDSVQSFNVVFSDMDLVASTTISAGAKLIINVPKGWTEVSVTGDTGFVGIPAVTQFGDNSHQIVGITSAALGDGVTDSNTITFTARAPNITSDRLYVMYVLAQGTTSNGFSIGPLAEVVLQVDG
ncbi:COG1361 family protein [Nitrosopumilus sp. S4]